MPLRSWSWSISRPAGVAVQEHVGSGHDCTTGNGGGIGIEMRREVEYRLQCICRTRKHWPRIPRIVMSLIVS